MKMAFLDKETERHQIDSEGDVDLNVADLISRMAFLDKKNEKSQRDGKVEVDLHVGGLISERDIVIVENSSSVDSAQVIIMISAITRNDHAVSKSMIIDILIIIIVIRSQLAMS